MPQGAWQADKRDAAKLMGYRYQNKLDEENKRCYWEKRPRWLRKLIDWLEVVFLILLGLLALYASVGWILVRIILA